MPAPKRKLPSLKLVAISPLLMLFVVSCSNVSHPSVLPAEGAAKGNSYRLLLPSGTKIALPDERSAAQVRAVAADELTFESLRSRELTLEKPLQLVSPGYIAQRNTEQMALLQIIDALKEENARLRAR